MGSSREAHARESGAGTPSSSRDHSTNVHCMRAERDAEASLIAAARPIFGSRLIRAKSCGSRPQRSWWSLRT